MYPHPVLEMEGQKYGKLTVITQFLGTVGKKKKTESFVTCLCDCGREKTTLAQNVKRGRTVSCGCKSKEVAKEATPRQRSLREIEHRKVAAHRRRLSVVGNRFHFLTVTSQRREQKEGQVEIRSFALCQCDCGNIKEVLLSGLRNGTIKSCGCHKKGKGRKLRTDNKTHGKSNSAEYTVWVQLNRRCNNPGDIGYPNYGGRGITVCDRWRGSFEDFYEDMGERPKGLELDRKDNDLGYSKENCRWVTRARNMQNTRRSKIWTINGIDYPSLKDASKTVGKCTATIIHWCEGVTAGGVKIRPPRKGCSSRLKYK